MAAKVGSVVVDLLLNTAKFEKDITKTTRSMDKIGRNFTKVGKSLTTGLTLPIIGAGAAVVKFAMDFNKSMANVATLIPNNTARVNELKKGVQDLAITTGKSTSDMADGLYQVISAFGDSGDTMKILETNARAAAAGLATTTDAINLTSAVTKGYGDASAEATEKAADLAFQTVKLGQTTFPELAASIGRVVPVAAKMNVAQEELFAGFATLTGVTGNAAEVSTQLSGILRAMIKPTQGMSAAIAQLGYESSEAMVQQLGMVGALDALIGTTDGSTEAVGKLFGRAEALTSVFALTGQSADDFSGKLDQMRGSAGAMGEAFREQAEGVNKFGFTMDQLKARFQVAAERLGDALLPVLEKGIGVFEGIAGAAIKVADIFAKLPGPVQTSIVAVAGLAAAIGPLSWAIGGTITSVSGLIKVLPTLVTGLKTGAGAMGMLGKVGIAVGAFWVGWKLGELLSKIEWVSAAADKFADIILKIPGIAPDVKGALSSLEVSTQKLSDRLKKMGINVDRLANESIQDWAKRVNEAAKEQNKLQKSTDSTSKAVKDSKKAVDAAVPSIEDIDEALRSGSGAMDDFGTEAKKVEDALKQLKLETERQLNPMRDVEQKYEDLIGLGFEQEKVLRLMSEEIINAADSSRKLKTELTPMQRLLETLANRFTDLGDEIRYADLSLEYLKDEAANDPLKPVTDSAWEASEAMLDIAGQFGHTGEASEDFNEKASGEMNAFGTVVSTTLTNMTQDLFAKVKTWAGPFGDFAAAALSSITEGLMKPFMDMLTGMGNALGNWLTGLVTGKGGGFDFGGLFDFGSGEDGKGGFGNIGGKLKDAGGTLWSGVTKIGSTVGGAVTTALGTIGSGVMAGLTAVGGALSTAMTAIWSGLAAAGPVGWIGAAGVGAYIGIKELVGAFSGPNSYEALTKEIARDYGGVNVPEEVIKAFLDATGISEPEAWDIRKNISSSPAFLLGVVGKFAEEQGKINEFLTSLEKLQTSWGTFNFRTPFETGLESGDWSALNDMWESISKIGTEDITTAADNFGDLLIPSIDETAAAADNMAAANDTLNSSLQTSNDQLSIFGDTIDEFTSSVNNASAAMENIHAALMAQYLAAQAPLTPLQSGTDFVPRTGPYMLHRGERVVPASQNRNYRFESGPVNLNFVVHAGGSDDMVQAVRTKIIPIIMREMAGGPTGLRDAIRYSLARTQGGF